VKFHLHDRDAVQAWQSWCRRTTHVRREAASEINRRKIPSLVKSAYEMVPSALVMTARSEPSVVIHFCVLQRIDPQLVEQCEEFRWKCVRSGNSEIPTIGAIAHGRTIPLADLVRYSFIPKARGRGCMRMALPGCIEPGGAVRKSLRV
jgi:hypothetical protein